VKLVFGNLEKVGAQGAFPYRKYSWYFLKDEYLKIIAVDIKEKPPRFPLEVFTFMKITKIINEALPFFAAAMRPFQYKNFRLL
jgi:hypothetical protein